MDFLSAALGVLVVPWRWLQVLQSRCLKAFAEAVSGTNGEAKAGKLS